MLSKCLSSHHSFLLTVPARVMSYATNLHHPPSYYVNGVKHINDYDIEEYRPQIQAFLTKRRTVRREVPPRAWILKDMGDEYKQIYY